MKFLNKIFSYVDISLLGFSHESKRDLKDKMKITSGNDSSKAVCSLKKLSNTLRNLDRMLLYNTLRNSDRINLYPVTGFFSLQLVVAEKQLCNKKVRSF